MALTGTMAQLEIAAFLALAAALTVLAVLRLKGRPYAKPAYRAALAVLLLLGAAIAWQAR